MAVRMEPYSRSVIRIFCGTYAGDALEYYSDAPYQLHLVLNNHVDSQVLPFFVHTIGKGVIHLDTLSFG